MSITSAGFQRLLELIRDELSIISLSTGEKAPSSETIVDKTLTLEVYFSDTEGNGTINSLSAKNGSGTSITLDTVNFVKDNTQGLTVSFDFEVREV